MPNAYPVDSDITALINGSGITLPSGYSTSGYAAAAIDEWEKLTGFIPFLNTEGSSAQTFDPPGVRPNAKSYGSLYGGERVMALKGGLVSVASVVSSGQTMVLGTDYRLRPGNAAAKGKPFTWIEFAYPIWGLPDSVVVTGVFGYCSGSIPQTAWDAIVRIGAAMVARDVLQGIYASPTDIKEGDEAVQQDSFRDLGQAWEAYSARMVDFYKLKIGFLL